jgi:hypothetical protein
MYSEGETDASESEYLVLEAHVSYEIVNNTAGVAGHVLDE